MNVLVIDFLGLPSQEALLRSYVRSISTFANVTLAATKRFHVQHSHGLSVDGRLILPELPFDFLRRPMIGLDQIRKVLKVRRHLSQQKYDHIVVLSYETITLSLFWNRQTPCWVVHHANLDELCHCATRRLLFSRLQRPTRHLVFCEEFADMLRMKYNVAPEVIAYPATSLSNSQSVNRVTNDQRVTQATRVFVPSRQGCKEHGKALRDLALGRNDLNIIMRGDAEFVSRKLTLRRQFIDYQRQVQQADVVFCAGRYHYRVSTVAYEALSAGKPVLMWDGPFANSLRRQFPSLVKTITRVDELPEAIAGLAPKISEIEAFSRVHQDAEVISRLRRLLDEPVKLTSSSSSQTAPAMPTRRAS